MDLSDPREMVFQLMGRAFVWIRAESVVPEESGDLPSPAELANLFHNVPGQLAALPRLEGSPSLDPPRSELEILQRITFFSQQRPRLAAWVRHHLQEGGFDYEELAAAGNPSTVT